jgi:hypothetical protein
MQAVKLTPAMLPQTARAVVTQVGIAVDGSLDPGLALGVADGGSGEGLGYAASAISTFAP